jgi:hypothetical protein
LCLFHLCCLCLIYFPTMHTSCITGQVIQVTCIYIVTCISDFRRGFGLANRFIGYSPGGTTINYNNFNLTVTLRNCEQWLHSKDCCWVHHIK